MAIDKVDFIIEYFTQYGEDLEVVFHLKGSQQVFSMEYANEGRWIKELAPPNKATHYHYQKRGKGEVEKEWGLREMPILPKGKDAFVYDHWKKANFPENYLSTALFKTERMLEKPQSVKQFTHFFNIKAPIRDADQVLCVIGNAPELGGWEYEKAIPMQETSEGVFEARLDLSKQFYQIEYKYGVYSLKENKALYLESGDNRRISPNTDISKVVVANDVCYRYLHHQMPKVKGVAVPVFSLRSQSSMGIGEFSDLRLMGDWAHKAGLGLIQILPINDTIANKSWTDSYPYAAISVYALNPVYISVANLPYPKDKVLEAKIELYTKELNVLPELDLERVMAAKFELLQLIFDQNVDKILKDKGYTAFLEENASWVKPYSVFCVMRDEHKTADFSKWKVLSKYDVASADKCFSSKDKFFKKAHFYAFIQYHLDEQLRTSIAHLHSLGVKVKGDLPIGIYRHSVEAWKEPELFGMDFQAGAPPDDFAVAGQNWEFPTYHWEKMKEDGYAWWKNRFAALEKYFDAMRIDHILGFFRIWRMAKEHTQGIMGYFYPAIPVARAEFDRLGIPFSEEDFCKPYITESSLKAVFGEETDSVASTYFEKLGDRLFFKTKYNTQRKIEEAFSAKSDQSAKVKLINLAAQVLFLTEERGGETVYHPRFNISHTLPYKALPPHIQRKLDELYFDYFFRRQESLWKDSAMEKLPMLMQSTKMLICGEDLGFVPKCVPDVMDELAILSLQVQRMPNSDIPFHDPAKAPYLSVVTPATHDTSTVRQWWEEDHELTKRYYYQQIRGMGYCPLHIDIPCMYAIIKQHLDAPSMLSVIPLQEWLFLTPETTHPNAEMERINIPAIFPHYWKYRMQMTLEELVGNEKLTEVVRSF